MGPHFLFRPSQNQEWEKKRKIPINQTLRETLQNKVRHIRSEYVFVSNEGNRFNEIRKSFKSALKRPEIMDFRFYNLRNTFASHLVMAGWTQIK